MTGLQWGSRKRRVEAIRFHMPTGAFGACDRAPVGSVCVDMTGLGGSGGQGLLPLIRRADSSSCRRPVPLGDVDPLGTTEEGGRDAGRVDRPGLARIRTPLEDGWRAILKGAFIAIRKLAPRDGFEPPTNRLTVDCSTAELPGSSLLPRRGGPIAAGLAAWQAPDRRHFRS